MKKILIVVQLRLIPDTQSFYLLVILDHNYLTKYFFMNLLYIFLYFFFRPHNAFFYFSQERRSALQKEFPHLNKKEIASILTQKWNEMPVPEKEVYIQLQNERKHQYQMIMAQYNELNKESQI